MAVAGLLGLDQNVFLIVAFVDQPVLPFALTLAVDPQGRVERGVAAQTAVHIHDILLADTELGGD